MSEGSFARRARTVAPWLGLVLMLGPLLLYAVSGLVAPGWAVICLLVLWAAAFVCCLLLRRSLPYLVLAMPFILVALWFAVISAGEHWLGWTA
ncbi:hypothetical protein GCM10009841_11930 [Microlunatus panaciterrae]|uniref:DUF4175 domain-containing protein n=1 Tax=Microlunatus panaciterrae TaxID=400768 RepID=A0ABS2RL58_9ACTN|nr:hypothetical protein [Microlunatus panaciterrae]MBM7799749.1 hypothetical protein [Microlunatus panaciterrae]